MMRVIITVLVFLILAHPLHADPVSDAKQAGSEQAQAVLDRVGSGEGINQRFSLPVISSNTPMSTMNDQISFSAQLSCPSSVRFLDVFVQPAGSGDLQRLVVGQDIDMDGNTDYTYTAPFPVSGVCANGVISCDPGTWQNCMPYRWAVNASLRISLADASMNDLGGCYCINSSCGSSLPWTNLAVILRDLGGGAVGALQKADSRYAVTDVRIDGTLITYYGQASGSCTNPGTSGPSNPQQYYSSPGAISSDTESQVMSQSQDPQSYYSQLTGSIAAQQSPSEVNVCWIRRIITVNTICPSCTAKNAPPDTCSLLWVHPPFAGFCGLLSNSQSLSGNSYGQWIKDTLVDEIHPILCQPDIYSGFIWIFLHHHGNNGCCVSNQLMKLPINSSGSFTFGHLGHVFNWQITCNQSISWCTLRITNTNTGCSQQMSFDPRYPADQINETIDNQCTGFETNTDCRLKEEIVDGVYTYRDFNPTGLAPLPSCRTFTGIQTHEICRDWWEKKRTYICSHQGVSFDLRRSETVLGSVSDQGSSLYYQDLRLTDQGWISESASISLPSREAYGECEMACKTRKLSQDTQAVSSGTTSDWRTTTQSWVFSYKTCTFSGGSYTCPVSPQEEIVKDCQCINEFAEASAIMSSLREAARDLICSSGIKR